MGTARGHFEGHFLGHRDLVSISCRSGGHMKFEGNLICRSANSRAKKKKCGRTIYCSTKQCVFNSNYFLLLSPQTHIPIPALF